MDGPSRWRRLSFLHDCSPERHRSVLPGAALGLQMRRVHVTRNPDETMRTDEARVGSPGRPSRSINGYPVMDHHPLWMPDSSTC